jgi:hypothetical protein
MARSGASPAVPLRAGRFRTGLELNRLEAIVLALDPGSRALLDLSLRRGIRDDDMAQLLRVDPFNVAWLRARAIERIAAELGMNHAIGIGLVRAALPRLPDRVWSVPSCPAPAALPAQPRALTPATRGSAPPYTEPRRPAASRAFRAATRATRSAMRARPEAIRAAARGALLAGAGAVLGMALSRRRR